MNLLAGGAIGGALVAGWQYVKMYIGKIWSMAFVTVQVNGQSLVAIHVLLAQEFSVSPLGTKTYRGGNDHIRPLNRNQLVAFETLPTDSVIYWRGKGWKKRFINVSDNKFTFIRGTFNRDDFVREAVDKFNQYQNGENQSESRDRFFVKKYYGSIGKQIESESGNDPSQSEDLEVVSEGDGVEKRSRRYLGWNLDDIGQPKKENAIDFLSLDNKALETVQELTRWKKAEKWFKERNIPWKRGLLMHGSPGTGKTAFVRALGQQLNMPIMLFDLSTMTNQDLIEKWAYAMDYAPCIVLFEDIDAVFCGRENIACSGKNHQGLTFDCFLNVLDGVENTDGILKVVTTNNVEHIDSALGGKTEGDEISSRPGRIDKSLEFLSLNAEGRFKMASRIFCGFEKHLWEHLLEKGKCDTGAQFQERCCQLAQHLFWGDEVKTHHPKPPVDSVSNVKVVTKEEHKECHLGRLEA